MGIKRDAVIWRMGGVGVDRHIRDCRSAGYTPSDGVGVLVRLPANGGAPAAPVVEDDRLVGIATRCDLIAVLARRTMLARPWRSA